MSLVENSLAPPTRFDLNFRVGDIPVRVHPFFWAIAAILGWNSSPGEGRDKLVQILVCVAVVAISVLVHELGHILMGRWFGNRGHIVLAGLCGLAVGSGNLPERWKRIAVSLAGPGAGFLLAALVFGISWLYYPETTLFLLRAMFVTPALPEGEITIPPMLLLFTIQVLLRINIYWGLLNLLPIWPLDGGQVCREICQRYRGSEGLRLACYISLTTAIGFSSLALIEFIQKKPLPFFSLGVSLFAVVLFALLAVVNWQLLQAIKRYGPDFEQQQNEQEPLEPWQQDADWWKRGDSPWRD